MSRFLGDARRAPPTACAIDIPGTDSTLSDAASVTDGCPKLGSRRYAVTTGIATLVNMPLGDRCASLVAVSVVPCLLALSGNTQ